LHKRKPSLFGSLYTDQKVRRVISSNQQPAASNQSAVASASGSQQSPVASCLYL